MRGSLISQPFHSLCWTSAIFVLYIITQLSTERLYKNDDDKLYMVMASYIYTFL